MQTSPSPQNLMDASIARGCGRGGERRSCRCLCRAVTPDAEIACKQHRQLRLPFPILDGQGMRRTFGAELTPRLVVLDGEGFVRLTQTGWGYQTPQEIQEVLQRCEKK